MKNIVRLCVIAILLVCSPGTIGPPDLPTDGPAHPGETYSLEGLARSLLGGCTTAITYSVVEANGGAVNSGGVYTAPGCATPPVYPVTVHVKVDGCNLSAQIPITLDEKVLAIALVCVILPPGTACADPSLGIQLQPGSPANFYAKETLTCRSVFVPPIPAGACTQAFCQ